MKTGLSEFGSGSVRTWRWPTSLFTLRYLHYISYVEQKDKMISVKCNLVSGNKTLYPKILTFQSTWTCNMPAQRWLTETGHIWTHSRHSDQIAFDCSVTNSSFFPSNLYNTGYCLKAHQSTLQETRPSPHGQQSESHRQRWLAHQNAWRTPLPCTQRSPGAAHTPWLEGRKTYQTWLPWKLIQ